MLMALSYLNLLQYIRLVDKASYYVDTIVSCLFVMIYWLALACLIVYSFEQFYKFKMELQELDMTNERLTNVMSVMTGSIKSLSG